MHARTITLLASAAATAAVHATLRRTGAPGGPGAWQRRNHAGRTVDLYGGVAVAAGTGLALATAPGAPGRVRAAAGLATAVAGVCGAYDDQAGRPAERGFRAHLTALRAGRITSGTVRLVGIGAAGLAAGVLLKERPLDRLLAGVVVAGTAHLVNLLDVRPGRAVKAVVATGLALGTGTALAAAPVGAAAAIATDDLGERTMLGDAGAHALGAALGVAAVETTHRRAALALSAATLVALAAAGHRVSYSRTLWNTPVLRALDAASRRPGDVRTKHSRDTTRKSDPAQAFTWPGPVVMSVPVAGPGILGD
jgi:UDP-N-acetylmuramyl pentapeptide phosphotransferase/UDP-N-acetylglucosamine-1-phosphate transferase